LVISVVLITLLTGQVRAQSDVVAELKTRLLNKGVPVKDIVIKNRNPFQVEITLQSTSSDQNIKPDDAIFVEAAHYEVALLRKRQTKLDVAKVVLMNSQGQPIYWSEIPVDKTLDTAPVVPSKTDRVTVIKALQDKVPLSGMVYQTLDVGLDEFGAQVITIRLTAQDIEQANNAIPTFMATLPAVIRKLKDEQGAQIASYRVDVSDSAGTPLLKYVNYYLASEEHASWWQADNVTSDWFPHPPPPARPANSLPAYPPPLPPTPPVPKQP
jgi:hypothetical protein